MRPRQRWFRRRPSTLNGPADWYRLGEFAAQMQRRELLDAIADNRKRRERAQDEYNAASRELDELLAFGRTTGVARYAEMGEAAGMTKQAAVKRLKLAGAVDAVDVDELAA